MFFFFLSELSVRIFLFVFIVTTITDCVIIIVSWYQFFSYCLNIVQVYTLEMSLCSFRQLLVIHKSRSLLSSSIIYFEKKVRKNGFMYPYNLLIIDVKHFSSTYCFHSPEMKCWAIYFPFFFKYIVVHFQFDM